MPTKIDRITTAAVFSVAMSFTSYGEAIAQTTRCPRGETALRLTSLCPAEAREAFLSNPVGEAYKEKSCRWVVSETALPGSEDVLLYLAQRCGNETAKLEISGTPNAVVLQSKSTVFGDDVKIRGFPLLKGDPKLTINTVARAHLKGSPRARQCAVRDKDDGNFTFSLPPAVAAKLDKDGPGGLHCGNFGERDDSSHWRNFGGRVWHFELGQDAWQSIDSANVTLLQRDTRGDGLKGWRVKY